MRLFLFFLHPKGKTGKLQSEGVIADHQVQSVNFNTNSSENYTLSHCWSKSDWTALLTVKVAEDLHHGQLRCDEAQPHQPYCLEEIAGSRTTKWTSTEKPVPESQHLPSTSPFQNHWGPLCYNQFHGINCVSIVEYEYLGSSSTFSWGWVTLVLWF